MYNLDSTVLSNIRIVMVHTWHPGNIGSAARAMKTMGLSDLVLVKPKDYDPDVTSESYQRAHSMAAGAVDVLDNATIVETLDDAIDDCQLVLATSARSRSHPWPIKEAREMAGQIVQEAGELEGKGKVAILFGPERMGLHNDDLRKAHYHVDIPGNPDYPVLNVASAIQILCYECMMASRQTHPKNEKAYPMVNELNGFYEHLEDTLNNVGFLIKAHPGQAMLRLKRLFNRARPEKVELNMLRGILSNMDKLIPNASQKTAQEKTEQPNTDKEKNHD